MATSSSAKTQQSPDGAIESSPAKKKPVFKLQLFDDAVAGILLAEGILADTNDYVDNPAFNAAKSAFVEAIREREGDTEAGIMDVFSVTTDAIAAFEMWIESSQWRYYAPAKFIPQTLSVEFIANAPSGQMKVAMSFILTNDATLSEGIKAAKDALQEAFNDAFPARKQQPLHESSKTNGKVQQESAECDTLRSQNFNGKLVHRLIPTDGKWQQFGIPLYEDIAKKFGIRLPNKAGEKALECYVTYDLKPDGKPSRVDSVEFAETDEDDE